MLCNTAYLLHADLCCAIPTPYSAKKEHVLCVKCATPIEIQLIGKSGLLENQSDATKSAGVLHHFANNACLLPSVFCMQASCNSLLQCAAQTGLELLTMECNMHAGFLQQFAAVCHPDRAETNMAAVLRELSGGETPNRVICCGHSLGGALATLGALHCAVLWCAVVCCAVLRCMLCSA